MRGINNLTISGNVGDVVYGRTSSDTLACSFMIASERMQNEPVWVRVNVYGPLTNICRQKLDKGSYVVVKGELMNRNSPHDDDRMVEIRCEDIVFVPRPKYERNVANG